MIVHGGNLLKHLSLQQEPGGDSTMVVLLVAAGKDAKARQQATRSITGHMGSSNGMHVTAEGESM
jgi:hypothetical protein